MHRQSHWFPVSNPASIAHHDYALPASYAAKVILSGVRVFISGSLQSNEWIGPEQEVKRIIVDVFKTVPEVASICADLSSPDILIWTLLDSYNREARQRVYEKELGICKQFHLYDFDFRVTSIQLVSAEELVRSGLYEIYRRQ